MSKLESKLALKIKTCMNDDIRVLKGSYNTSKDAFESLKSFIKKSYGLKDLNDCIIQYLDDEGDMVTIVSDIDFEDAIEEAENEKKSLKLFIKTKSGSTIKSTKKEIKPKMTKNGDEDDVKDKEEDATDEITGDLVQDICNNEEFKKEVIIFLSTIVVLYQSNKNDNEEELDLKTCIVTALSQHKRIAEHKQVVELMQQLDVLIPQTEPLIKEMLLNFDVKKIGDFINKLEKYKKKNNSSCDIFKFFDFPMIFGNILEQEVNIKTCPGKHELYFFETNSGNYSCDGCNYKMVKKSPMYGCRKCNYDLCLNCYGIRSRGCGNGFGCKPWHRFGRHTHHHNGKKFGRRCGKGYHNNNNNNNNGNNYKKKYIVNIVENPMPIVKNAVVDENQGIIKKWKLKNEGSESLPKGLLVRYCGRRNNPMVSTEKFFVGNNKEIKPGEEFIVQVCIKTPNFYGRFFSNWRLCTPHGRRIGVKLPFCLVLSSQLEKIVEEKDENDNDDDGKDDEKEKSNDNSIEKAEIEKNEKKEDINDNNNDNAVDIVMNDSDNDNSDDSNDNEMEKEKEKEEYHYSKQLEQLKSMGFDNEDLLKAVLEANDGQIDQVVAVLVN